MDQGLSENICDEKIFGDVYLSHSKTIRNFIYYKCGDPNQAEDVMQQAFLKLWENCKKVVLPKARSFLYTVSNNLFLNEVKSKKVALKYAAPSSAYTTNQSPEYVLEEKQFKEKLDNAIASLTEAQRTAFLLNRIDGKKYAEIAELLGISVKAVEKRIHKALVQLRQKIEGIK